MRDIRSFEYYLGIYSNISYSDRHSRVRRPVHPRNLQPPSEERVTGRLRYNLTTREIAFEKSPKSTDSKTRE
tara:strand:- start:1065 stop:1280 length:216 start_codon:yes stop_codon:yes gene_type:complete